jgi:hypothetical protein
MEKNKDIIDAEIVEKEASEVEEAALEEEKKDEVVEVVAPSSVREKDIIEEEEVSGLRKVFQIDEETYLEYANYISKGRSLKTTFITAIIIALAVYFFIKTDNWLDSLKYMGIYAGAYIVISLMSSRVLTPRMMKNTYRKRDIGSIKFDIIIREKGFLQYFEEGKMDIPWSDFKLVQETEKTVFLTMFNKRAILLPKSVYSNEEWVEVRNILNRNLDEAANQLIKHEDE